MCKDLEKKSILFIVMKNQFSFQTQNKEDISFSPNSRPSNASHRFWLR